MCVQLDLWCASVAYTLDQFEGTTCVTTKIPWWWYLGSV